MSFLHDNRQLPELETSGEVMKRIKLFVPETPMMVFLIALALAGASTRPAHSQQNGAAQPANLADAIDPMFKEPYIDVDEWRDKPMRHRYVHGGFKGTDARFSFYFPPKERYQGRFFQHITPAPGGENLEQHATGIEDQISFAIESGGYFIETNEGGPSAMMNPSVSGLSGQCRSGEVFQKSGHGDVRTWHDLRVRVGRKRRGFQDNKRI